MKLRACDKEEILNLAACALMDAQSSWAERRAAAIERHEPYWIVFYDEKFWECEAMLDRIFTEEGRYSWP